MHYSIVFVKIIFFQTSHFWCKYKVLKFCALFKQCSRKRHEKSGDLGSWRTLQIVEDLNKNNKTSLHKSILTCKEMYQQVNKEYYYHKREFRISNSYKGILLSFSLQQNILEIWQCAWYIVCSLRLNLKLLEDNLSFLKC